MARLHLLRQPPKAGHPVLGSFLVETASGSLRHLNVRCLELPWNDNRQGVSCIPPGDPDQEAIYRMRWTMSSRFKAMMWEVTGVPSRAGIRIHTGNYAGDKISNSQGCLLPCMRWVDLNGDGIMDGASSRQAMQILESELRPFEATGIDLVVRYAKQG